MAKKFDNEDEFPDEMDPASGDKQLPQADPSSNDTEPDFIGNTDDDPNKTKEFAKEGTVESDEIEEFDPNKTAHDLSNQVTVDFDDDDDFVFSESNSDIDINKTARFDESELTVEFDADNDPSGVAEDAITAELQNKPGEKTIELGSTEVNESLTFYGDAPPVDKSNLDKTLQFENSNADTAFDSHGTDFDIANPRNTNTVVFGTDNEDDSDLESTGMPQQLDKTIQGLSTEDDDEDDDLGFKEIYGSLLGDSGLFDDSVTDSVAGANHGWGQQAPDATPMTSLEAPTRGRQVNAQLRLNDRLVIGLNDDKPHEDTPDYVIKNLLGEGAMGKVYIARQTSVDRDVAFKIQIQKKDASRRKRLKNRDKFLFEAQITAKLDHPNIVAIHDMGRDQHGEIFYCMELVRGKPWDFEIQNMSLDDNLQVLLSVIDGISYAHANDTIHRDLKPENIMLGSFGEVLVMDWGLGVDLTHGPPQSMGGTPGFMAPEMARPPSKGAGKHSDIYLLGAILFSITTGQAPHRGNDVWECLKNAANNVIDIPASKKIDQQLLRIALKAMSTNPQDRYASAEQLRAAIENYQSNRLSIKLSQRSESELETANSTRDYATFSKSLFGFREALTLWPENEAAIRGESDAKLAYASCALDRQDFELGMSLLDERDPDEVQLFKKLQSGAKASNRRRRLVWLGIASSILLLGTLVVSSMLNARAQRINNENLQVAVKQEKAAKQEAEQARSKAVEERRRAQEAAASEREANRLAQEAADREKKQRELAEESAAKEKAAREEEKIAREAAVEFGKKAEAARELAENSRKKEMDARQVAERATADEKAQRLEATRLAGELQVSESSAQERLFQSNIGLIDGNIRDNQIEQAIDTLKRTRINGAKFANWEWNRLYHLCHTEVKSATLPNVTAVDHCNTGATAIVSANGTAKFWNPQSGQPGPTVKIANAKATCVALTNDGTMAAIGSADPQRKLVIWDVSSGRMLANLTDQIDATVVSAVAFDRRGTSLAVGDSAKLISVFAAAGSTWNRRQTMKFHSSRPVDLDFSDDGKRLASASGDGLSIVWNVTDGSPFSAYKHSARLNSVNFRPGTRGQVFCATSDREIVSWDSSRANDPLGWQKLTGKNLVRAMSGNRLETMIVHDSTVNDVDFSDDGKVMVTCGDDRTIAVWNVNAKTLLNRFRGHVNAVLACCSDQEGKTAVTASADGQIRYWRFDEYEDQRVYTADDASPIRDIAFNSDGSLMIGGDDKGVIRVWNRDGTKATGSKLEFDPRLGRHAIYLPRSKRIVTSSPGAVFVWQEGRLLHQKEEVGRPGVVAVTPDERFLITGGDEDVGTIVWNLETGEKVATLLEQGSRNRVTAIAVSPDDGYVVLATGLVEGVVSVFELSRFQLLREFEEHRGWITDLAFSPSSNQFISSDSIEGYVNVWSIDGRSVNRIKKINNIGGSYIRVAYNRDGSQFVTSSNIDANQSELQIWDSTRLNSIAQTELVRPIDFVSFLDDEVAFRLNNGKAYAWKHQVGPRKMREVPQYSNASYSAQLNGWSRLPGNQSLVFGNGFVKIIDDQFRPLTDGGSNSRGAIAGVLASAGNPGPCTMARFANDDSQVVALYKDGAVRFWDRKSNAVTKVIQTPDSLVTSIDVSPDNSRLVAMCDVQGNLNCVDVTNGETVTRIDTGFSSNHVRWVSPSVVAVAANSGLAMLINVETQEIQRLGGDTDELVWVDVAANGSAVVGVSGGTGARPGQMLLWQQTGADNQWTSRPMVFGSQVLVARISPDGKRIFSGDETGAITVWYVPESGSSDPPRKLISLLGHEKGVTSIVLSQDGKDVASSSDDGSAILWLTADADDLR